MRSPEGDGMTAARPLHRQTHLRRETAKVLLTGRMWPAAAPEQTLVLTATARGSYSPSKGRLAEGDAGVGAESHLAAGA